MPAGGEVPYLTVVRGEPTDAELAAVVTVLTARWAAGAAGTAGAAGAGSGQSEWASKHRLMRQPAHAGPGAWRASTRRW